MSEIDWNEIFKGRKKASLPNILKLPMVPGRMDILSKVIRNDDKVLDMGANDRTLEKLLLSAGIRARYFSFDIDKTLPHDYYDLDNITDTFDAITAFELVEHMKPFDIVTLFKAASRLLKKGGVFVVSTPNVCHPVHFWRDCTHITPVRYDELYGLLASSGFGDIKIYRSGKLKKKELVTAFLYRPLIKLLKMDFVPSIIAVAKAK